MAVHRGAHLERHGEAHTLREMLVQEGFVAAKAGCQGPVLDVDDLAYTRVVIGPLLDARDRATIIASLFGDIEKSRLRVKARFHWKCLGDQANQAAQGALGQAQAQAPQSVQNQLQQAAQKLAQAQGQLGQGQPAQAGARLDEVVHCPHGLWIGCFGVGTMAKDNVEIVELKPF